MFVLGNQYLHKSWKTMSKRYPVKNLPSAETILWKQPSPPPKTLSLVVCDNTNSNIPDDDSLIRESIPPIDIMPYFESKDEYDVKITLHRETTYICIKSNTIKVYIFGRFSAVEKITLDEAWKECRIAYTRGNMPDISKEVLEKFDFSLNRFEGYPRGIPRDLDSPVEMRTYYNPQRTINYLDWQKALDHARSRNRFVTRPFKSREIWRDTEEIVFKLLIDHYIPLEYIALFYQDKEKCIKERARWRWYARDLRIMKNGKWTKGG